jgi:hypothetical protein
MVSFLTALAILPLVSGLQINAPSKRVVTQAPICGDHGYDAGTEAYYDKQGNNQATISVCSARCAADAKCLSFAIGDNACLNYAVAV